MKKEGFTKWIGYWRAEFFAHLPTFEGLILDEKTNIIKNDASLLFDYKKITCRWAIKFLTPL